MVVGGGREEGCKRAQEWMSDLGGDGYVNYLNCGEVFVDLTYSNTNQSIHFKYVPSSVFQLYLNKVKSKKKNIGPKRKTCVWMSVRAKLLQPCLNLCNPMDRSLPGSSVHGILQTRILEWVALPSILQGIFLTEGSNLCLLCLLHWQEGSLSLALLEKPVFG